MLPEHVDPVNYLDWENAIYSRLLSLHQPSDVLAEVYWAPPQGVDN